MGGLGFAQLSIIYSGAYVSGTEHIDGVEIYEKSGDKYTKIYSSESKFVTEVTLNDGETKTYVARVYAYNKSNEKVYSAYSNTIVLPHQ